MSKLFIYGCSHSTNHNIPPESFWGYLLSKKLKLELPDISRACPGRGLGHIITMLQRDIYNKIFEKGDVVIWNTSYPARFSTPYLHRDIEVGMYGQDTLKRSEYKITDIDGKKKRLWADDMDMMNYWFEQTVVGYDILKSMGVEVYQWNLINTQELDGLLKVVRDRNQNEMELEQWRGKCFLNDKISNRPVSSWENLIEPPDNFGDWVSFIESSEYMISPSDTHMNETGHTKFSNHFYDKIMEMRHSIEAYWPGLKITHKETDKKYANMTLDYVLNVDTLKEVGDDIDNILFETWKEQPSYFIYDDMHKGETQLETMGIDPNVEGEDLPCFLNKNGDRIGNGRLQTYSHNIAKLPDDLPKITKIVFDLFGYDEPTKKQKQKFIDCVTSFCVFWDPFYTNEIDVNTYDNTEVSPEEHGLHLDGDEFIWFKVNPAKTLNVLNSKKNRIKTLNYSYLAPQGFWHNPPEYSFGVSFRIGVDNSFFKKSEWMSERHSNLIDYINEFDIVSSVIRGGFEYNWEMIDYSEARKVDSKWGGSWYEPGNKNNVPMEPVWIHSKEK